MRRLFFLFNLCMFICIKSANSSCPLCDAVFNNDQITLEHIDTSCLIANPKLAFKSTKQTELNCKVALKVLDVLQGYIFGTMHKENIDILAPQHKDAQRKAHRKLKAIIEELNMPKFCKDRASELAFEMKSLVVKAKYRARIKSWDT